jgi:hypothetical protein
MRRVLRVRTAFEPTRSSAQQLQFAYERVVETVRRTLCIDRNDSGDGDDHDKEREARSPQAMEARS